MRLSKAKRQALAFKTRATEAAAARDAALAELAAVQQRLEVILVLYTCSRPHGY